MNHPICFSALIPPTTQSGGISYFPRGANDAMEALRIGVCGPRQRADSRALLAMVLPADISGRCHHHQRPPARPTCTRHQALTRLCTPHLPGLDTPRPAVPLFVLASDDRLIAGRRACELRAQRGAIIGYAGLVLLHTQYIISAWVDTVTGDVDWATPRIARHHVALQSEPRQQRGQGGALMAVGIACALCQHPLVSGRPRADHLHGACPIGAVQGTPHRFAIAGHDRLAQCCQRAHPGHARLRQTRRV